MKILKNSLLTFIALFLMSAATSVKTNYFLDAGYNVTINGTSNIHNWNETVNTVSGEGSVSKNTDGSFDVESISIKMEVHSIKSDMGSIMNNNTYKALKADANPQIIFSLIQPIRSIQNNSGEKLVLTKGNLTIAGVTNVVDIKVKIYMLENGKLSFEGKQVITMTDYGIAPPTALLGTLETGNEITISFKTTFAIKPNL